MTSPTSKNFGLIKVFFVLVFFCSINYAHAQTSEDWTLQSEKDGVNLYAATLSCDGKKMLVLKFENTNQVVKQVNYNIVIKADGHNIPLLPQSLELKASESKTGSCDSMDGLIADIRNITSYQLMVMMAVQ